MSNHNPTRAWTCGGCGDPWPCVTRRQELLAEYFGARASLTHYLTELLCKACQDMPQAPAGALYDRFVGWVR
jgi:hypothetical protein